MSKNIITIMLLLGAVALGLFFINPELQRFKDLRVETNELNELSAELDTLIQDRDSLIGLLNSFSEEDLVRLSRSMPEGSQASQFLVYLESLAAQHGLTLRQLDITQGATQQTPSGQPRPGGVTQKITPAGNIKELEVLFKVGGTYENMKRMLKGLEHNIRIVDIKDMSFQSPTSLNDVRTEYTMKLKTYYQ